MNYNLTPNFSARRVYFTIISDVLDPNTVVPPLYMHVNPSTLNQTFQKKIHRYTTNAAYVEEHWGEELDHISANGSTGGFFHSGDTLKENVYVGKQNVTNTYAYFKFQDLLDLYRNNANTYDSKGRVIKKGLILMSYDVGTYFGEFENFSYTEIAESPWKFSFNFVFKVEKTFIGF